MSDMAVCSILQSSAPDTARLKITEELLLRILTYHQVSPHFLSFLSHICQDGGSNMGKVPFGGFQRLGSFARAPSPAGAIKSVLRRSGHQYELVFELRTVCNISENGAGTEVVPSQDSDPGQNMPQNANSNINSETSSQADLNLWPITQSVVYHRFDVITGKSLWVMTAGNGDKSKTLCPFHTAEDVQESLSSLGISTAPKFAARCFASTLSALVHLGDWSLSDFDSYITTLNEEMQRLVSQSMAPLSLHFIPAIP